MRKPQHWSFENQKSGVQFVVSHPSAETLPEKEFCLGVTKHANIVFWLCPIREKILKQSMTFFCFFDTFKHKLWLIANSSMAGKCNLRNAICKKCPSVALGWCCNFFGSCRLKANQLFPGTGISQRLQSQFCNSPQAALVGINEIPGQSSQKGN